MSLSRYFQSFLFPRNLKSGSKAPLLSLTADDGTWVKSEDALNRNPFLLVGVKDIRDSETITWLKSFREQALEELQCKTFIVSHQNFEQLREARTKHAIPFLCLTDPFALEARKFGLSGRRPLTRNGIVLVSQKGLVHTAICGRPAFQDIIEYIHQMKHQPYKENLSEDAVEIISSAKVQEYLQQFPETKIVDVRTLSEFEPDHVPNSIHIPLDELPQRHPDIGQIEHIVFICQAGQRAYSAAEFLVSIGGREIYVSEGGMSSWTGPRRTDGKIS